ncbi:Cas10/Cmr2 second palm domain-containing protein [Kordia sp.]|uniref:Cas10/Cmr2 second palm domain-containing protein n=1 Tax=Kordia sp. TaxID=1965332 RepID=UPI003B5A24E5
MHTYYYGFAVYSIQSYIFETNKLKEIIGASEIVEKVCKSKFQYHFKDFLQNATILLQAAGNIRCVFSISDAELDRFKEIYAKFSMYITLEYPELKFCQAILDLEEKSDPTAESIQKLNQALATKKQRPVYYPRLACMGVARNQRTRKIQSYPIESKLDKELDLATKIKHKHKDGKLLLDKLKNIHAEFPIELEEIASEQSFIALVHIDTNGLGNFIEKLIDNSDSKALQKFSNEVEAATINALETAIKETFPIVKDAICEKQKIPFRPVLIGGDDVTVIIKAEHAFDFTRVYMSTFEDHSKQIKETKGKGLTVASGIAFTKQKFPLHYTADLVEDLCKNAKTGSNREYSAIRVHRVRNTYASDFERIKDSELTPNDKDSFYNAKPFSIVELAQFQADALSIKKDDFPKADLEEHLSQIILDNPQRTFLKDRMLEKLPKSKAEFIKDMHKEELDLPYLYNLINLQKLVKA